MPQTRDITRDELLEAEREIHRAMGNITAALLEVRRHGLGKGYWIERTKIALDDTAGKLHTAISEYYAAKKHIPTESKATVSETLEEVATSEQTGCREEQSW